MWQPGWWCICVLLAIAGLCAPESLHARQIDNARQRDDPIRDCATLTGGTGTEANRRCNILVQSLEIVQGPLGMAMSGGNPVPGTASTMGMRLGSVPRLSLGTRLTLIGVDLPQILHQGGKREIGLTLPGLSLDAAIGLLPGASPLPTIGGVASVDVLASIGILPLPTGAGFESGTPFSWAFGLRAGVFRESFTLPGISVSAMYRHLGRSTFGDPLLQKTESFFDLNVSALSFRGAVGKRIAGLGLTAGAGFDRYSSSGDFGFASPAGAVPEYQLSFTRFKNNRTSLFGNISYTFLILHLVGEVGWQQGPGLISAPLPANAEISTGGHLFGGVAARLSI